MSVLGVERGRLGWYALGAVLGAALLFVLYSFVGTFVFGLFIYYATRPVYVRLDRRLSSSGMAAAMSILALALPVLLLVAYTLAVGIQELNAVAENRDLGALEEFANQYVDVSSIVTDPTSVLNDPNLLGTIREVLGAAQQYVGFVGTGLLHLFIMLALAYYLLRDGPRLGRFLLRRFGDEQGVLDGYARAVDRDLATVFFGNILNAILTGVIGALAYTLLNAVAAGSPIPYPFLLGLLTGIASLIPVVGMKLVYVPVAGYLLATSLPDPDPALLTFVAVFVVVSFLIVDVLPDFVLRPIVSGGDVSLSDVPRMLRTRSLPDTRLHVGSVMFAYIFGPLLFGWYGIFLGPILLVLVIHFARLVLPELVAGETLQPGATDPGTLPDLGVEAGAPPGAAPEPEPDPGTQPESDLGTDPEPDSGAGRDGPSPDADADDD
jgi:predicted PurR-regulated permease PerM